MKSIRNGFSVLLSYDDKIHDKLKNLILFSMRKEDN